MSSTNLNPNGEALAQRFSLRLAVFSDGDGGCGGRGSDGDGAVGDVLAGRAVHLSVSRLYGGRQGLHAVDALRGVGQSRLGTDARSLTRPPVHVRVLGGLCAALGRDGNEGFGWSCPWRDRGRCLFVGGDAWWHWNKRPKNTNELLTNERIHILNQDIKKNSKYYTSNKNRVISCFPF